MGTTARTRFRHARFYITFRCNARCGYCNVWQDPVFFGHDELEPDDLRRCLDQVRELGVDYIDFTGGEPALHRHLAVATRHARQLGMRVEVTTNAIRFARQAEDIVPNVDTLNISIDTLSAERYHAIRGTDTLDRTLALVERLRGQQMASLKLIAVVTSQTLPGIDALIGFAQSSRVPVYLSPMFEYFDRQSEYRVPSGPGQPGRGGGDGQPGRPGRAGGRTVPVPVPPPAHRRGLLAEIRARTHVPYTIVNLDFLRHIETLDPSTPTACGAGSRILTIGPDGRLLLPCYHEWHSSLRWDRPYLDLTADPEFVRVRDTEVGQLPGCRSCAVFPYIGLASSYRLTADFLVQAVSTEISKLKACLQGLDGWCQPDAGELAAATERLLDRLAGLSLRPGTHPDELYYFAAAPGRGAVSDLAGGLVTVEEVLADHANEDCWPVQRTPHRIARQLYTSVVPALVALAGDGSDEARRLALSAPSALLCLWQTWLEEFRPEAADRSRPARADLAELAGWCSQAGQLLTAAGRAAAARSVTAIALLTGIPADRLRRWGGLAGHPDELYLAVLVSRGLRAERRAALAPCFSEALAAALAGPGPAPPGRTSEPSGPGTGAQPLGNAGESAADLGRAAGGDPAALAGVCALGRRYCLAGDTRGFRALVREWKAATGGDSGPVERMLLAAELGATAAGAGTAR